MTPEEEIHLKQLFQEDATITEDVASLLNKKLSEMRKDASATGGRKKKLRTRKNQLRK